MPQIQKDQTNDAVSPQALARPSKETIAFLQRLIAFETVSRDSNLGLIEWVRDYLITLGIKSRFSYSKDRRKANLFATIGERPGPGIVLSGHTDVVPVDGQNWATNPFLLHESGDRLFGRGTADMKSFIAVLLSNARFFAEAEQGEPVHFALSYDEEVGCLGVREMLRDLEEADIKPRGCIIGEPTSMQVKIGHKGSQAYRCTVAGREAHSSLAPQGVNAIEFAARIVEHIRQIGLQLAREERRHEDFDVPLTTLQTGVIKGGIATNIVPKDCEFRFDIRHLPWTRPETIIGQLRQFADATLIPEMRQIAPESDIRFDMIGEVPALDTAEDSPLANTAKSLAGQNRCGYISFGTEGGLFQRAGIPAVVCGPGSIEQAHKPNEFVDLHQIALCEAFMQRFIQRNIHSGDR